MALPEAVNLSTSSYPTLDTLFDTRDYKTSGGLPARGVQAVERNAFLFQKTHQLDLWRPNLRYPYDRRNSGTFYAHFDALTERMKFESQFYSFTNQLHTLASFGGRSPQTLGYLSLISSAGFSDMIYKIKHADSNLHTDQTPADLLNISEFNTGLSYVAHVWMALGVIPEYEITSEEMTDFVLKSGILIGNSSVCPISPKLLNWLIGILSKPSENAEIVEPDTINGILDLGLIYESTRLASAIPWSSKPSETEWNDWTKVTSITQKDESQLCKNEQLAAALLGFHPRPRLRFTPEEIRRMRVGKTVHRDDLSPLLYEILPKRAFLKS